MAEETPGKAEVNQDEGVPFEEDRPVKSSVSIIKGIETKDLKLKPQIALFRQLIENHYQQSLRLNEMTGKPEYFDRLEKEWREWADAQDSQLRAYFQSVYGLYSPKMLDDALSLHFAAHRVNPLLQILDKLTWDGKPRVERFLHDVLKADDNEYVRECSRLIFAGGVHRAFRPGCKFDDMIVLIGDQGCGKSATVRFLNMEDRFYKEIKTISGKEGIEALSGMWIGEMSELMAMTRVKESEAVKAYITTQTDSYRPPYGKHVVTVPRRCVFIGTTNNPQFLTDRTGNRRFYPVQCHSDGYEVLKHEDQIREYVKQAWAEAVQMFREGKMQPFARHEVLEAIRQAQESAMEDDWRIGAIEQYLKDMKRKANDTVSVIELWHMALGEAEESKPGRADSIALSQIMERQADWVKSDKRVNTRWGLQRVFIKYNPFFPAWK